MPIYKKSSTIDTFSSLTTLKIEKQSFLNMT